MCFSEITSRKYLLRDFRKYHIIELLYILPEINVNDKNCVTLNYKILQQINKNLIIDIPAKSRDTSTLLFNLVSSVNIPERTVF